MRPLLELHQHRVRICLSSGSSATRQPLLPLRSSCIIIIDKKKYPWSLYFNIFQPPIQAIEALGGKTMDLIKNPKNGQQGEYAVCKQFGSIFQWITNQNRHEPFRSH